MALTPAEEGERAAKKTTGEQIPELQNIQRLVTELEFMVNEVLRGHATLAEQGDFITRRGRQIQSEIGALEY